MYLRRFKNRQKRSILDLKGRFSLIHLGGGTFLYSFPGKHHPVVGKIELGRKKYRNRGLGVLMSAVLFMGVMSVLSNAGTADSISLQDLEKMEAGLSPRELEEKSERLKSRLLSAGTGGTTTGRIVEYKVKHGDTLGEIAGRYKVPIEMITASSRIKINSILRPGQVLTIPHRRGLAYKFKKGDTLAAVMQYYSVKLEDVARDNPKLTGLDIIAPGTRVFLPNAKIPAPPPVWYRPAWGRVSSRFGPRRHPVLGTWRRHNGIDIAIRYKTIRAARSGHVIFSGRLGSYGKTIIIEHRGGYKTLYAHLSRLYVRRGQYVKARKPIGVSGNTGLSTGPHLHFELIRYGRPINPRRKIRF